MEQHCGKYYGHLKKNTKEIQKHYKGVENGRKQFASKAAQPHFANMKQPGLYGQVNKIH